MNETRLQPLLSLAERRVDAAAGTVQQRRAESTTEQARLDELRSYLADYEQRMAQPSSWQLANHAAFISRLRQAVTQQEQTVARTQQAVDNAVGHWTEQRLDQRRFEILCQQAHDAHATRQNKREQHAQDDLAARHTEPKP
ncbi:MAG: flagellar export protein FliJ [Nevskiaceae bacterium]|nr:MAG: flagellar export protein FliJ [Nevskiaceae bacterium]TBR72195.1 MAG: flagellar export protein FliJ [Nevskiaceae bacterium]